MYICGHTDTTAFECFNAKMLQNKFRNSPNFDKNIETQQIFIRNTGIYEGPVES